jgi:acyl carrier protein
MSNDRNEIVKNVKLVIAQAVKADPEKIEMSASLIKDLGAESIDFLDIVFRLEKTFKIKIPKGELFPEKLLTDARFVKEGKITEAGIEELKKKMPGANWQEFSKNPLVANLGDLFTVGMIVDYLTEKLAVAR